MKQHSILKAAAVLVLIDLFWLATGGIFFRALVERIQGKPFEARIFAAAMVYVFLAYMLLETKSYQQAFLYGVCIYGVYDFTNLAIFTDYDWRLAIADTLWGGFLMAFGRYMLQAF
jgi:uncharacterized membrane protein